MRKTFLHGERCPHCGSRVMRWQDPRDDSRVMSCIAGHAIEPSAAAPGRAATPRRPLYGPGAGAGAA